MKIEKIKLKDIKPYEKNAKIHTPEQIEQIKKSIQEFGMNDPIAVWGKDNLIVEGHGRLEALKQLGHGEANIIIESSVNFFHDEIEDIVWRIAGENINVRLNSVKQDAHLSKNQEGKVRCGDNGIFKGVPLTENEKEISRIAREIYEAYPTDGKYILTDHELIICQSNADSKELTAYALGKRPYVAVNPIGDWTGGPDVDSGATNRKLGSDMAQSVTGGGIHGKDLSKADVSVNIYAFLKAQETGKVQEFHCAIGDETIDGRPYSEIVEVARAYIKEVGGFEKFAEWGLF